MRPHDREEVPHAEGAGHAPQQPDVQVELEHRIHSSDVAIERNQLNASTEAEPEADHGVHEEHDRRHRRWPSRLAIRNDSDGDQTKDTYDRYTRALARPQPDQRSPTDNERRDDRRDLNGLQAAASRKQQ